VLVVVRVWGCNVDDVDVGVCREGAVAAVRGGGGGSVDFAEEVCGARGGGRGCGGGDEVVDVVCIAGGRVDEEVFGECWGGS